MSVESHLIRLAQGVTGGPTSLIKLCLFDWSACAIAGRHEPVVEKLLTTVAPNGASSIFAGDTYDPATAALINGTMGHALDYDDTHFDHIGHTSAVIMPAVLAMAQEHLLTETNRVIEAALVGAEAAVRTGLWLGRDHYQIGFHQTATAGAFGATVALCRLLRLDRDQIKNAIGLTATMASGLKSQFGTMGKPLNAGLAARTAVEAVMWARAGMTADPQGLTSFGATHHGMGTDSAWDDEEPWKISRISHKFHACCHGLHAMLEALRQATVAPDDIAELTINTHPRWLTVCNQPTPDTGLGVKFSYRHTAAMALHGVDTAQIGNFSETVANDPALVAYRDKVTVVGNDGLSETQAELVIKTQDGQDITLSHDLNVPMPLDMRETRLRAKAVAILGHQKAAQLWDAINSGDTIALFD